MTVRDLMEFLEEYDPDTAVKIAYQPHWPLATDATFVKEAIGTNRYGDETRAVYICESPYGGNEYAPGCLYNDDEDDDDYDD